MAVSERVGEKARCLRVLLFLSHVGVSSPVSDIC